MSSKRTKSTQRKSRGAAAAKKKSANKINGKSKDPVFAPQHGATLKKVNR
jgi:hypothetical protein